MKVAVLRCPNCNTSIDERSRFCPNCGSPVMIEDEAKSHYTFEKVDNARIREADVRESIRLKELEIELLKLKQETTQKRIVMIGKIIIVAMYLLLQAALFLHADVFPNSTEKYYSLMGLFMIPLGILLIIMVFRKTK